MKTVLNIIPPVKSLKPVDGSFTIPRNGNIIDCTVKKINPEILGEESYRLEVTPENIIISASSNCGLYRGFQTVKQLVKLNTNGTIPCFTADDCPRFSHRAFMIDSCRHMQTVAELKKMIDAAALLKYNVFHWHLSDDQGFRFQCENYTRLNTVGSYRDGDDFGSTHKDGLYGGFYTKDEMREIVSYCASKYIDVIPEIDMPGHVTSLIASYPELSCEGKELPVCARNGILPDILCAGKKSTYEFVYTLLDEVCEVFPSRYIHIGGDEAPKVKWYACDECKRAMIDNGLKSAEQLQGFFTGKIVDYLTSKGRKAIVWNDSLKSGLVPDNVIVQYWMGSKSAAVKHANNGGALINSDFYHYYADYPYGMTPLRKTYSYEPLFGGIKKENTDNLIGAEMPVWTEFICDEARMHYLAFPRLAAFAETAWCNGNQKNYRSFKSRMIKFTRIFNEMGIIPAPIKDWDMHPARAAADLKQFLSSSRNDENIAVLAACKKEEKRLEKEFFQNK